MPMPSVNDLREKLQRALGSIRSESEDASALLALHPSEARTLLRALTTQEEVDAALSEPGFLVDFIEGLQEGYCLSEADVRRLGRVRLALGMGVKHHQQARAEVGREAPTDQSVEADVAAEYDALEGEGAWEKLPLPVAVAVLRAACRAVGAKGTEHFRESP